MDRSFDFSSGKSAAALRLWIIRTVYHCDVAVFILFKSGTGYKICLHQTYLIAREETEIFLRRFFHKIISVDIQLSAERNLSHTKLLILQIVDHIQIFHLIFRIIVNDQLDRIQYCHHTRFFQL